MIKTNVKIECDEYIAEFRSDLGGNCYRLYHKGAEAELLRSPENEEALKSSAFLYGNPILFPPNRIRGGEFEFEGRKYAFPINETKTNCHLHGALHNTPFIITEQNESCVEFFYEAESGEYLGFPHAFRLYRRYELSKNGLFERITVFNDSMANMPFMLAFHTTFNSPFIDEGDKCFMLVNVTEEHLRDEKYLPTGEVVGKRNREKLLNNGEYRIGEGRLSAFYGVHRSKAYVIDPQNGYKIAYDASEDYKYRMLWVKDGGSFSVIEPQTCAIDCFHLDTPATENGLIVIPPGKNIRLWTKISLVEDQL